MTETTIIHDTRKGDALGQLAEFWGHFSENKGAVGGLVIFVLVCLMAIFADVVAPHLPQEQYRDALLKPPFWQEGSDPRFLLGTDALGRDILSRLIYGSRYSLFIGVIVVTISLLLGVAVGLFTGFFRGALDNAIMRVMDVILSFPSLLLALVLVALLGPSLTNAMIAIALIQQPHYVRLTRAAVMTESGKDYVTAAKVAGVGKLRLMFVTILPNCMAPLIVQAALSFSSAILDAAALGFLGMGAQPPTPEWGTMLADAREYVTRAWWVVTMPGLAILITVLAINLMGDGLRDALDPRLKRSWGMTEAVIALTSALLGILLSNGFAVFMAYRQRQQRMLDLVIALHAEIDAGLQTIGRQLTEEEIAYAMRNSNPFGTPDETDTVFESVKNDVSILPIDVIHEVVRYYRLARQTNLLTADTRHPMFFNQRPAERHKFVGQIMRKGNEQYGAGVAALEALERFGAKHGRSLDNKRSGPRDVPKLPDLGAKERLKRTVRSVRKSLLPRTVKSSTLNIRAERQKEK